MMHTPGPWTAEMGEEAWEVNSDGKRWAAVAVVPANNLGVAEVDDEQAEHNARLIAAAPDLLSALKRLWESSRSEPVGKDGKDCWLVNPEALADALVAIKKAEGK